GADGEALGSIDGELDAGLVGDRLVQLGDVLDNGADVDVAHAGGGRRAGLHAGDHQERIERLGELVGLLDRPFARRASAAGVGGPGQRRLDAVAQARQRRLQIVGDVIGDVFDAVDQVLDTVEHVVQAFGQAVELVAGALHVEAAGEVAQHDAARSGGERIDAL